MLPHKNHRISAGNRRRLAQHAPRVVCPVTAPVLWAAYCKGDPFDDNPGRPAPGSNLPGRRRPGDVRQHRAQAGRAQDPAAVQRVDPRRVCRVGRRFLRAVLAVRIEARTVPRQSRAVGRRARARLAHRPPAAAARGDDDRRRPEVDLPAVRNRRSDRARRRHRGGRDRAGRSRWPRRARSRATAS